VAVVSSGPASVGSGLRSVLTANRRSDMIRPMATLAAMPAVTLGPAVLAPFGAQWTANGGALSRSAPNSSMQLGDAIDTVVAAALAAMLGGISVVKASQRRATQLYPPEPDCVETAPVAVVGGIRKQNYDVVYRPDGVRFAFDSKTLNDAKSVGKNWQNMVNDLATEAATIHTRFPMAVVAFLVLIPQPAVGNSLDPITWRLDGLGGRTDEARPSACCRGYVFRALGSNSRQYL
jgi:hypothetical protein